MTDMQDDPGAKSAAGPDRTDDSGNAGMALRQGELPSFKGGAALYRNIAMFGSLGVHAYLFVGFYCIKNFVAGEPWPTHWLPIACGAASTILFAFFAYRWIMRLDARYGRGSGWILETTPVKLPWQRHRD